MNRETRGVIINDGVTYAPDGMALESYEAYSRRVTGPPLSQPEWESHQRFIHNGDYGPKPVAERSADNRCGTCHRDAHRPTTQAHGNHGHPYRAPEAEAGS